MMFGLPFLITPYSTRDYLEGEAATRKCLETIGRTLERLRKKTYLPQTSPLDTDVHWISPGDWVLIKSWTNTPLTLKFEGPFQVLFTTHTAVQTQERGWTHITLVKGLAPPPDSRLHLAVSSKDAPEWVAIPSPGNLRVSDFQEKAENWLKYLQN